MKIIVAHSQNRAIGKDNKLLWHLPEDLKRFKQLTTGSTIVMGRKTYESIGKPLPNRRNVILSRSGFTAPDCLTYSNIEDVVSLYPDAWVIGGAEIYSIFLPYITEVYLTLVNGEYDGDAFFPELNGFKEVEREDREGYSFIKLSR